MNEMSQFLLVSLLFTVVAFGLVCGDTSVESSSLDNKTENAEENTNSVKTKRGIFNHAIPYGHNYVSYSPYARFPGIYKGFNSLSYALTPGNAVIHSYNANYPKIYVPKPSLRPIIPPPLLVHSKPILPISSVPIYAKRFPVFVQKSVLLHRPHFVPTPFVPSIPSNIPPLNPIPISIPNVLPQSTLISQNGWKPVYSTVQSVQTPSLVNPPAVSVLPPFASSSSPSQITGSHAPNNYYLPPDSTFHSVGPQLQTFRDNGLSHANEQSIQNPHDIQAHLQQLQHIQEIQNNRNFLRNDQSGIVTPLSEQGYETASNNGRYSGPSSYDVQLSSF